MCPPGYHRNGFVATHALGHMMYGYTLLVPMNPRVLNLLLFHESEALAVTENFPKLLVLKEFFYEDGLS